MQRFAVKKWWSVVVSERGPYVSYDEAQTMIDRLRADRDRHRNDNKLLWEQIAEQKKAIDKSIDVIKAREASYNMLDERYWSLVCWNDRSVVIGAIGWAGFIVTLIVSVVVLRGGVL